MSLTVDISLAQIAFITAETASIIRRFCPDSGAMQDLAQRIERFLSARADTLEARMYADEVLRAWRKVEDTPEQRDLLLAHRKLRGIGKQDRVVQRLRQLRLVLEAAAPPAQAPARRRGTRRRSVAG